MPLNGSYDVDLYLIKKRSTIAKMIKKMYISILHHLKITFMNTNKFLVGGIVGGIVSFVLGYLFYNLLFKSYFDENAFPVDLTAVKWWANIAASLLFGFLFSYIFEKAKVASIATGATMGFVIGLILEANIDLGFYSLGMLYKNLTIIGADVLLTAVIAALIGASIIFAGGLGKKAA